MISPLAPSSLRLVLSIFFYAFFFASSPIVVQWSEDPVDWLNLPWLILNHFCSTLGVILVVNHGQIFMFGRPTLQNVFPSVWVGISCWFSALIDSSVVIAPFSRCNFIFIMAIKLLTNTLTSIILKIFFLVSPHVKSILIHTILMRSHKFILLIYDNFALFFVCRWNLGRKKWKVFWSLDWKFNFVIYRKLENSLYRKLLKNYTAYQVIFCMYKSGSIRT